MRSLNTYPLDSTAQMLPYSVSKTRPPVFRFEAVLTREIEPGLLKQAVLDLTTRFPVLYTRLRRGFIWDYLAAAPDLDIVKEDGDTPCRSFNIRHKRKPLLRVLYKNNKVAVECCHLTADGTVCVTYLSTLITRYLELSGYEMEYRQPHVLRYQDTPGESELKDYLPVVYEKPKKKISVVKKPVFRCLTEKKGKYHYRRVTRAEIPIDAMKSMLKEKYGGCTITEYLTAVYASAFLELNNRGSKKKRRRNVRLSVPTNLRNFWKIDTLRNFTGSAYINVIPESADYSFTDILELIRREMKEKLTEENMRSFISQNVRYLNSLKMLPGFLKRFLISAGSPLGKLYWPYTAAISNIGYIKLPPSLAEHVQSYAVVMGGFDYARIACAAMGVNNVITVAFTAISASSVIQDYCLDFFARDGLPVTVNGAYAANQRGDVKFPLARI